MGISYPYELIDDHPPIWTMQLWTIGTRDFSAVQAFGEAMRPVSERNLSPHRLIGISDCLGGCGRTSLQVTGSNAAVSSGAAEEQKAHAQRQSILDKS